ncbi:hypothetical protein DL98DRAFT_466362 [Cadophora sp. DSE1049]|nr:hypothetical protein DL98DRAFT_466362 [Cadophora sp. DSE1049]
MPLIGVETEGPIFRVAEGLIPAFEAIIDNNFNPKDKRVFQDTTLADLKQFLANLQARQVAEGHQQGFKRLAPLIDALEQFRQFVDEFCDSTIFMAFVWRASLHKDALNEVLNMYKQIGLVQPLHSQYEELIRKQPEMYMILSVAYSDMIRIHKLTLTFFEQRRWEDLFVTTWTRPKSRCYTHITKMANRLDLMTHRGTASQFATFQFSGAMEEEEIRTKLENEDLKRKQAIYTWLKAVNMQNEQDYFAKIRKEYPSTGHWLLGQTAFNEWFDPQFATLPPLLWLHGNPGAGKTILASMVVEEAKKLSPTPTILFFYCKQDEGDRDNFISMARTLLSQLLMQNPSLLDYIYNKCCNSGEAFLSSRVIIEEILSFSLENCNSAYIVLDGLDECCSRDERRNIVEFFRNLIENLDPDPDRLHCLFVSRKDSARKDFYGLANIEVGREFNEDDIDAFSQVQSQKLGAKLGISGIRLQEIVNFVSAFAEGIFLVAELVWINLCGQTSIDGLEQEMDTLPTDLDKLEEAYSRIMRTIRSTPVRAERDEAIMLLRWLVCAKRPLRLHEVQTMKSINLHQRTIEFDRRRFRVEPKDLCESLVDVRPDGSIELVHSTAKFKSEAVDIAAEEVGLSTLCVDYLNLPCFIGPFPKQAVIDGNYGFMEYAILNWVRHFEAGLSSGSGRVDLMDEFFESMETLLETHWNNPTIAVKLPKRKQGTLNIFESSPKQKEIQQVIASTQEQARRLGDMRPGECALDFTEVVAGIRKQLESVVIDIENTDTSIDEDLKLKYGTNLFKCSRFSCKYFTYGFATKGERDGHVERHERPFRCTDIHCTGFIIGFALKSHLAKHLRETHSELTDQDQLFPTEEEVEQSLRSPEPSHEPEELPPVIAEPLPVAEPEPEPEPETHADTTAQPIRSARPTKRMRASQEYECAFCGKNFSKKFNWESHLKTHGPSEKYPCDMCNTVCARKGDLERHKKKHSDGNAFICRGVSVSGQAWGCGTSFLRADILRNHHKSKKGKKCLAALSEEEQVQIAGP